MILHQNQSLKNAKTKPYKNPKLALKPTLYEPWLPTTTLHEQFEHQNVPNFMENGRFEPKMLQIPLTLQFPAPKCCK